MGAIYLENILEISGDKICSNTWALLGNEKKRYFEHQKWGSKLLNQQTWGIYEEIWGCWPSLRGTLR